MKFMKLSVLFLLLLFQSLQAHAGDTWSARYYSSNNYRARSLAAVADGGYIVAGHVSEPGALHIQLLHVDRSGSIVWQKKFFSGISATAYAIAATDDGNYVVSAYAYSPDRGTLVFKVSPDGTLLWQSFLYLPAGDSDNVRQTKDHGYVVTGYTDNSKAWVVKLDASGKVLWSKTYGYSLYGRTIYEGTDGSLYLAGAASSPDLFVAKLSATGNVVWARTYGGRDYDMLRSMKPTADGGFIMAGYSSDTSGYTYYNWIMKITAAGDIQWSKKLSTTKQTGGIATQVSDGKYVFISKDAPVVIKLDENGNMEWQKPAAVIGSAEDIITTSDGGYAVASSSGSYSDMYIFKFGDLSMPDACITTSDWETISSTNFSATSLSVPTASVTVGVSIATPASMNLDSAMVQVCSNPTPAITVDKSSIPFGSIPLGQYGDNSVTIGNSGKATLSVTSLSLSGTAPGDFTLLSNCAASLAPGNTCTAPVRFTPASNGDRSAALTITSNDPKHPSLVVSLSGKGVSPHIVVSPSSLQFPDTELPRSSSATLVVSNTGDYPLNIGSYILQGDNSGDFSVSGTCGSVAGGTCLPSVTFTPKGFGSRRASLGIVSDDPVNQMVTVPLSGNGVDLTPPVSNAIVTGTKGNDGWFLSDAVATITATDTGSGVKEVVYTVDDKPAVTVPGSSAATTFAATGVYNLSYFARDLAGNTEKPPSSPLAVKVDKSAPVTKATVSGAQGNGGWFASDVTVKLASTDEGSGMSAVTYRIDNGTEVSVPGDSASVLIGNEGAHILLYGGKDKAGNSETNHIVSVSIDKTPPTSTITLNGPLGSNGWYKGDVSVTIHSVDALSGPAAVRYSIDGGGETSVASPTASFMVRGDGLHAITCYSLDNAGNVEQRKTVVIKIDATPPVSTISVSGPAGSAGWFTGNATVTLHALDATSGVAELRYSVDDGAESSIHGDTATFTISTEGAHVIKWHAIDLAGNVENSHTTDVRLDKTPPAITIAPSRTILWPPNHKMVDVVIGGSAQDAGSGISSVVITVTDEYGIITRTLSGFGSSVSLEAWREGDDRDGRHYTVTAVATDLAGNRTTASTEIVVPHDMR
ncbi:MAG TPA: choice-of-anchor D domain-containing protein [Geobacteraceae bacterium]